MEALCDLLILLHGCGSQWMLDQCLEPTHGAGVATKAPARAVAVAVEEKMPKGGELVRAVQQRAATAGPEARYGNSSNAMSTSQQQQQVRRGGARQLRVFLIARDARAAETKTQTQTASLRKRRTPAAASTWKRQQRSSYWAGTTRPRVRPTSGLGELRCWNFGRRRVGGGQGAGRVWARIGRQVAGPIQYRRAGERWVRDSTQGTIWESRVDGPTAGGGDMTKRCTSR